MAPLSMVPSGTRVATRGEQRESSWLEEIGEESAITIAILQNQFR
jgi:hypothetical protein